MSILDRILETKREELEAAKRRVPAAELAERARSAPPLRGFRQALRAAPRPRVIAEIKRRSPSRGEIRPRFDPIECAKAYADGGAAALSVLTDATYFGGRIEYLQQVRGCVDLPILRKDFVIDAYQVDEARAFGADAVLLIVAALDDQALVRRQARARDQGLAVLVEVHHAPELERARIAEADLIGINNRDLNSFEVDLATSEALAPRAGEGVVIVAESGIFRLAEIERLEAAGADAFLVGESLMRQDDPGRALRELRGHA